MSNDSRLSLIERRETADKLLTVQEVAERLRVRTQWIYQRVHAGTLGIRITRVGAFLRFRESEVEAYIQRVTSKD